MKAPTIVRRAPRIGLAIGADRLAIAVIPTARGAAPQRRVIELVTGPDMSGWPALADAFVELRGALGVDDAIVSVALLPPLAQLRRLEMPRLRGAERRRVLTRDAAKYFFDAREPHLVDADTAPGGAGSPEPVVAAAASATLVEAVQDAARAAGWTVESIRPAAEAWLAAALRAWPILARGSASVLVVSDTRVDLLIARDGELEAVRRFPRREGWALTVADALSSFGDELRVALVGSADATSELTELLRERGSSIMPPMSGDEPILLAATFAHVAAGPSLIPERIREARARAQRRLTRGLGVVAAAGLVAVAALELWGAQRELAAIEAQRAAIRRDVARVMSVRDTIGALDVRLRALATRELSVPQWSAVIAELARHLPADAHLSGLRAQGDSLALEGVATRAAGVFEALQQAPGVASVRAEAPIRREMQADGQTAVERFVLAARVTAGSASALSRGMERR